MINDTPASAAEVSAIGVNEVPMEEQIAQGRALFRGRFEAWKKRKAADAVSAPVEMSA